MRLFWIVPLALLATACQDKAPTPKKAEAPVAAVAEPKWRLARTDEDGAVLFTPEVQTVGKYKRFWTAEVMAKPERVEAANSSGMMATRLDLIEIDCTENKIRALQTTMTDEKDWTEAETYAAPEWMFAHPDAKNLILIEHACGRKRITSGPGYATAKEGRIAYRASIKPSEK